MAGELYRVPAEILERVEDAHAHDWPREVERHQCTITRIEQLLAELGEPVDEPTARPI